MTDDERPQDDDRYEGVPIDDEDESSLEPSKDSPGLSLGSLWLPVLMAGAMAVAGYAIRAELRSQEDYHVYLLAQSEAGRLREELTIKLEQRRDALTRFAGTWASQPRPAESNWRASADDFLSRDLQYRAIEWREPSLDVRWSAPIGARLPASVLDPQNDELRSGAMRAVEELRSTAIPSSFPINDGTRQLIVSAPMDANGARAGYMVGVMRMRDLLDAVLLDARSRGFEVAAYEGPFLLFGPQWELTGDEGQYVHDAVVHWGGLSLTFKVWPSAGAVAQMRSPLVDALLWIGIGLGLVFGLLLYRMDVWRHRAHHGWQPEPYVHESAPGDDSEDTDTAESRQETSTG